MKKMSVLTICLILLLAAGARAEKNSMADTLTAIGNNFETLARQAAEGTTQAFQKLLEAIDKGEVAAIEALDHSLNERLVTNLIKRIKKGDLGALDKLLILAKNGSTTARTALDSTYRTLAKQVVAGDRKAHMVLEYAAEQGESHIQGILEQEEKAVEKPAAAETAEPAEKAAEKTELEENGAAEVPPVPEEFASEAMDLPDAPAEEQVKTEEDNAAVSENAAEEAKEASDEEQKQAEEKVEEMKQEMDNAEE